MCTFKGNKKRIAQIQEPERKTLGANYKGTDIKLLYDGERHMWPHELSHRFLSGSVIFLPFWFLRFFKKFLSLRSFSFAIFLQSLEDAKYSLLQAVMGTERGLSSSPEERSVIEESMVSLWSLFLFFAVSLWDEESRL